jgi:integrase
VRAEPPLLKRNPALNAFSYQWDAERPEMLTWSVEEMQAFLSSISDDRDYPLYCLLLNTGLRRGEALGLRHQDLHLDRSIPAINVRQQYAKDGAKGATFRSLKGKARHWRTIELDAETADVVRTHLQAQAFERRRDDYSDHGLVFCHPDGSPYDPDVTSRRFNALVAACGQVKAIRLHDCRHTHATLLLEAGEAMDYVADRLGDRLDTVARVCAHVTRSRREGGVARWAALKQAQPLAVAATRD